MKQKLLGSIAVSMVAIIFFSMLAILPVAHAAATIYLDPATVDGSTYSVGDHFNVTAYVSGYGTPAVFGWQVTIAYNGVAAGINCTRAWIGGPSGLGLPNYIFDKSEFAPDPAFTSQASVQIGSTLLSVANAATPPPDPALLAVFEFEILQAPAKFETLTTALDLGLTGADAVTYLLNTTPAKILDTILVNGAYAWAWAAPTTNPHLAVVPAVNEFNQFTDWIGTTFPVEVRIHNLDIGWALTDVHFVLNYDPAIIGLVSATINPTWAGPNALDTSVPGVISATASNYPNPSGDVLVLTVEFEILVQGAIPPLPAGSYDESPLTLTDILLQDHMGPITTTPPENGYARIYAKMTLPSPWLEVDPNSITMGPDLVIGDQFGKTFTVNVDVKGLHFAWRCVGIEFRLGYDSSIVTPLSVEEGSYLAQWPNRDPPVTFFISYINPGDPVYGDHILVGDLLLPDDFGVWTNFPGGSWDPATEPIPAEANGTIATITFAVLKQSFVDTYNMPLDFLLTHFIDDSAMDIVHAPPVDGMVTILPISTIGRRIDVWMLNYPTPYGGQGLDQPADLVVPQQEIELTAKVTYNWWPVAQKKVTFNIYDNQGNPVAVLEGITGDDGHAYATYRMPWPNVDPEGLFGVWTVIASVSVAEETVTDHLQFHYDYLVDITGVTTNKLEYAHLEMVEITVYYASHAQQTYNVVMTATIQDNLLVPVGLAVVSKTIGGAVFCTAKEYVGATSLMIPYWAYAGAATVHVNFLDKLPSEMTHVAVTPEATVGIYILPV